MFPRGVLVLNRSPVTIRHLGYSGLNRQLDLLHHFASQFQPRKVMRSIVSPHFLARGCRGRWHSIQLYSKLPMCALITATLSAFFPLKVILWWKKYKDSSPTLKDDSLSELYSPSQSMSLYSRFSRSIRSLSVSSFFFSLCIFIGARFSTYSATSFSGTMYLSENFLIASLSPLSSSLSSNNRLIWARGWKSSGSRQEFWQNIIWEFSIFAFGFGSLLRSSSFHSSGFALSLVPAPDVPSTASEE